VYPPRKEVFVADEPIAVLNAINDRGITHLAVPDRDPEPVQHEWKEPEQALDRMCAAWAYSPSGRTRDADVTITASSPRADANAKMALHSDQSYHERQQMRALLGDISVPDSEVLVVPQSRTEVVALETRDRIRDARSALDGPAGRTESYRRVSVRESLGMLHRPAGC
jgi:hypothetical protein